MKCAQGDSVCNACAGVRTCIVHNMINDDAFLMGVIAALLGALAVFAQAQPWLAWMAPALYAAATAALVLSLTFVWEGGHEPDAWFTQDNVQHLASQVGTAIVVLMAVSQLVGGIMMVVGSGVTAVIGSAEAAGEAAGDAAASGPTWAQIGGGSKLVGLISTLGIGGLAERLFSRQEAVLGDSQDDNFLF